MGGFRLPMFGRGAGGFGDSSAGDNRMPHFGGNQFSGSLPMISRPAPGVTPANTGVNNQPKPAAHPGGNWSWLNPGIVPGGNVPGFGTASPLGLGDTPGAVGGSRDVGNGLTAGLPIDPNMTGAWLSWLTTQMGRGLQPFNLSASLPGGGQTKPGQLSAPLDPFMQQYLSKLGSGQVPGMNNLTPFATGHGIGEGQLGQFASGGGVPQNMQSATNPISAMPEWQAMLDAQQKNIGENASQMKEQFNFAGDLSSSPMAQGMSDFFGQTAKDQNALLAQMQTQALESAQGRKLSAGETQYQGELGAAGTLGQLGESAAATGAGLGLEQLGLQGQAGQFLQGLDQQSIQNLYQEFLRTRPQYNPMISEMQQAAFNYPQYTNKPQGGGVLGGIMGGLGDIASIAGPLMGL